MNERERRELRRRAETGLIPEPWADYIMRLLDDTTVRVRRLSAMIDLAVDALERLAPHDDHAAHMLGTIEEIMRGDPMP